MRIEIKRFDKSLSLPAYQTVGAAAFDMTARLTTTIAPGKVGYIPLNVAIKVPAGHVLLLVPRSSTHKKGLILANSVGIGDPDFCGDNDEYKAAYYNFSNNNVTVERGERIAQALIKTIERVEWEEIDQMEAESRGGFGTTGI